MRLRKVIESGIFTAAIAVASVTTAVSVSAAETGASIITEQEAHEDGRTDSGLVADMADIEENPLVIAADDAEASEWENKLLVKVDDYLNIRAEAAEESELVGKLYPGAGADVVELGEEWTKISSGSVEGYVKTEYCVFGDEAAKLAEELCETKATTTESGIRMRKEASTDAEVVSLLEEGETMTVDTDAEPVDGWVAIEYNDTTAYLSADYVEVALVVEDAVSIEEERAAAEAAAQAAAAEAAAQSSSTGSSSSNSGSTASASVTTTTGSAVAAATDDVTLLAALIQCEAGGECYDGQLAVGAVVVNRVKSGSYPGSISGVIYQSGQFSPASSGSLARVISSGNISSSCYQAAQEALSGVDNTGGALHFHAGTSGSGVVIGNQIFY